MLSKKDIKTLLENNFIIRLPYRWRNAFGHENENTALCPLITGPLSLPRVTAAFYPDMVLPVNNAAKTAFEHLYNAIKQVSIGVYITPGRLVYVDNRFALHSREKFLPSYDTNGRPYRWLQRLFVTSSLWNFRSFSCKGGRIFDPAITIN